ncbi:MAG: hypothetical protein FJ009_13595 [Chloroflexi bacterium]|nr:hypothetical protein [Chloroflexota bacterium]
MITPAERAMILARAYIPEHLPHYVTAISQTEPFLIGDFVAHARGEHLIFVGYPLRFDSRVAVISSEARNLGPAQRDFSSQQALLEMTKTDIPFFDDAPMLAALDDAKTRFKPRVVSILAPALPTALENCVPSAPDEYYRLDLAHLIVPPVIATLNGVKGKQSPTNLGIASAQESRLAMTQTRLPQKTRNMLTRARREVSVSESKFGKEHARLIEEFLRAHRFDDATRLIFQRVSEYAKCETARVIDARNARGDLVAFDVADFGAQHYAFYMFNVRSRQHNLPGASDLLLAQIIERARAEGKRYVNLGLGVDAGVAFFKRKWGAAPFLKHCACVQRAPRAAWQILLDHDVRS